MFLYGKQGKTMTVPLPATEPLSKPTPTIPSDPLSCHFYVSRKKRFCKLKPGKGKKFCGEHLNSNDPSPHQDDQEPLAPQRIPCPFDPAQ